MHRHGGWNKTTSPRPPARLPGARWPCIYLFYPHVGSYSWLATYLR